MIAISDNHGYVLSPLTIAPVNKADSVLLADGLKDLKSVAHGAGIEITGATLNLDAGFDSKANRKHVFNAGMKPNIAENPRNRKKTKRGRKRFFDAVLYAVRFTIERVFAWEDKFKRLLLRFCSSRNVISDSNLWPSRSSISGSFVKDETCNQFYDKNRRLTSPFLENN